MTGESISTCWRQVAVGANGTKGAEVAAAFGGMFPILLHSCRAGDSANRCILFDDWRVRIVIVFALSVNQEAFDETAFLAQSP